MRTHTHTAREIQPHGDMEMDRMKRKYLPLASGAEYLSSCRRQRCHTHPASPTEGSIRGVGAGPSRRNQCSPGRKDTEIRK